MGFALGGIGKRFLVSPPSMSPSFLSLFDSLLLTPFQSGPQIWFCVLYSTLYILNNTTASETGWVSHENDSSSTLSWLVLPGPGYRAIFSLHFHLFRGFVGYGPEIRKSIRSDFILGQGTQLTALLQLFGYYSGLGMSVLTFDWGMISYIGSPLATPWWAEGASPFREFKVSI